MTYEFSLYLESQCPYRSQRNITWQVRVSKIYLIRLCTIANSFHKSNKELFFIIKLLTVCIPIVDLFPTEDPSLKIQIEDLFYLVKSLS